MFHTLFNEILYRPLLNGLAVITNIMPMHDIGLAIVVLTVLVRMLIYPITHHSTRAQAKMRELEPELGALKEKLKDNKEEQARRTMELYAKHGINPFSGCLTALLQIPIFIALYYVFWKGLGFDSGLLYSFVARPEAVRMEFLGLIPMAEGSTLLAVLAGVTQFFQVRLAQPAGGRAPEAEFARIMRLQMTYFLPVMIGVVSLQFPAAVALYWTANNIFAIVHEVAVKFKAGKNGQGKETKN